MTDAVLEILQVMQADLAAVKVDQAAMRAVLAPMHARLDSLPLINRTVTVIQQEVRALRRRSTTSP